MSRRVVVLGSDTNAFAAAHYIAAKGHEVTLVHPGAASVEDDLEAGWVPPRIVEDLELRRHGFRTYPGDPCMELAAADGTLVALTADLARSAEGLRRIDQRDAARWPEFCRRMRALAGVLESIYLAPPPDPLGDSLSAVADLARSAMRVRGLGRRAMEDFLRLLPMSAADWLDEWFHSDALKGALGMAAVRHLAQGPRSGGTAFNLLHHHAGNPPGLFIPPLSNARAALSRRPGIGVRAAQPVRIELRDGRAAGVVLEDGEVIPAAAVVSALTPARTLLELADAVLIDPELVRDISNVRARGVAAEVTLTVDRQPAFRHLVIAGALDHIERAYDDAKHGRVSAAPCIEARYLGPTGADEARHRVELHAQYVPYVRVDGEWDSARSEQLGRALVARVTEHVPGFADTVVGLRVLTPHDLEQLRGHPQGQPYHAEMALDQVLWMRPVSRLAHYRTPIAGLYLCGPAMHPGGGVAGAAGANAASLVLRELKRKA